MNFGLGTLSLQEKNLTNLLFTKEKSNGNFRPSNNIHNYCRKKAQIYIY